MKKKEVRKIIELLISSQDGCSLCEKMGQKLSECTCMTDKKCAKHILELWENFTKEKDKTNG